MSLSDRITAISTRPDRPLVVKCTFDKWNKRITFNSARNCSYELLRNKVEQCFALHSSSYSIAYKDDDGEVTDITTDSDLTEAIQYFQTGVDDLPVSSAASILSGRSFGSRKITLRVHITVEYDGPSLSDTSSLASMEEYKGKNGSEISLSFTSVTPLEQDDDSVTVSSRDTGAASKAAKTAQPLKRATFTTNPTDKWLAKKHIPSAIQEVVTDSVLDDESIVDSLANGSIQNSGSVFSHVQLPDDPSAVFERLKLTEASRTHSSLAQSTSISAQWLKDQKYRAFNGLMQPSSNNIDASTETDRFSDNVSYAVESELNDLDPKDLNNDIDGDLALQQDLRGKFYYTYTTSSGASQVCADSGFEEIRVNGSVGSGDDRDQQQQPSGAEAGPSNTRPKSPSYGSSLADSNEFNPVERSTSPGIGPSAINSSTIPSFNINISSPHIDPSIPPEVLKFMEPAATFLSPEECTECSECGIILDSFRYVCGVCGPKRPKSVNMSSSRNMSDIPNGAIEDGVLDVPGKGKSRQSSDETLMTYPPSSQRANSNLFAHTLKPSSSHSSLRSNRSDNNKPLPPTPPSSFPIPTNAHNHNHNHSHGHLSPATSPSFSSGFPHHHQHQHNHSHYHPYQHQYAQRYLPETGYELCVNCIQSVGVLHALSEYNPSISYASSANSSLGTSPPSPEETQRNLSMWRRAAPKWKGHIRHAYLEKVWDAGKGGWMDVEQEDNQSCSICNASLTSQAQRYKCVSCQQFDLCRGCYSQVHEIHPSHAFLIVPDKTPTSKTMMSLTEQQQVDHDPVLANIPVDDGLEERSMKHPGVKCIHCMQDIVGARFHCAICDSVDICSNCESAGLPGDLDAADGGHESSHIMIKIPYPLKSNEVRQASRRALHLWTDRDAPNVRRFSMRRPRANSITESEARTVVGFGLIGSGGLQRRTGQEGNHGILCKSCNKFIVGTRYQCASCPSLPNSYSLCSNCEPKSYILHDPMHIFFKLPRPLDRPIASEYPNILDLYKVPAGPVGGILTTSDPKAYLQSLRHTAAVCDHCMERITGEWFHCVYCPKDLCDSCESLDTHDETHFFLVFKSSLDMQLLRQFVDLENPEGSPPILNYPVYFKRP